MIDRVDHIGIVVKNLDDCLKIYEKAFQLKATHMERLEEQKVRIAFIPVGEVMIELLQPLTPGRGQIGEFLKKYGEGFHHIAYRVHELDRLLVEMKLAGIRLRDEIPRVGAGSSRIAFISPEQTNNMLVELVEKRRGVQY